eukprot:1043132-Amphidinium_carterae.1
MQFSTVYGLPEPRQRTKDADLGVCVVSHTAPSMMRVTTVTSRTIGPDRSYALPVNQGGLKVSDGRYPRRSRHLHFATFFVPVRTTKNDVRQILWLLFTTHAERPHMERAVRTHFMPNPSKGGIKSTTETVFSSVGTLL